MSLYAIDIQNFLFLYIFVKLSSTPPILAFRKITIIKSFCIFLFRTVTFFRIPNDSQMSNYCIEKIGIFLKFKIHFQIVLGEKSVSRSL